MPKVLQTDHHVDVSDCLSQDRGKSPFRQRVSQVNFKFFDKDRVDSGDDIFDCMIFP